MEKEFEDGWVDMEDRQPDGFDAVLIYLPEEKDPTKQIREGWTLGGNCFYVPAIMDMREARFWRPMPEPPKEKT